MQRFRQKPQNPKIVEAYQTDTEMTVNTKKGFVKANITDWIVIEENGELHVYTYDAFCKHFEEV